MEEPTAEENLDAYNKGLKHGNKYGRTEERNRILGVAERLMKEGTPPIKPKRGRPRKYKQVTMKVVHVSADAWNAALQALKDEITK